MMKKTLIALVAGGLVSSAFAADNSTPNLRILDEQSTAWTRNFNPWLGGLASTGYAYEPLFLFNQLDSQKEHPWLATSYEISEDLKTLTVDIREGVKWSDGEDFTVEDILFTFEYTKQNPSIDLSGVNTAVSSVEKIDENTIKFHLAEQNAFVHLNVLKTTIIPQHIWSSVEDPTREIVQNPVGTGPFTEIERFTPQVYTQCVNENYWNDDIEVRCLEFPQFSSSDAALEMMSKGSTDWHNIFVPDIDRLYVNSADGNKYWFPSGDGVRLTFNYDTENEGAKKAFSDVEFRKAASLAMDREAMRDLGAYGYVKLGNSATNLSGSLSSWKDDAAEKTWAEFNQFDMSKAKQILADAGYKDVTGDGYIENKDGSKLEFMIQVPSGWGAMVNNATIAVEGLREAGIKANLITPETSAYSKNWNGGNFDANIGAGSSASSVWKFYDYTMHSRYAKTGNWWSTAMHNYANQDIDEAIAVLSKTLDSDKQKEIVGEIERHYAENVVQIPLYLNAVWYSYNDSRFTGFFNADNPVAHPATFSENKLLHVRYIKPRS
jgi:peptide/nickel transport system substrate-binding protein